jgi:hypothetical protein
MTTTVSLICHRSTPTSVVHSIAVVVERGAEHLVLRFRLQGAVGQLVLPPPSPPRWVDGLWRHTCFEAFIGLEALPSYHELNLAPSGEWAGYAFRSYRNGRPLHDDSLTPSITVQHADDWLELEAHTNLEPLSALYVCAALRLGLSAVIEEPGRSLTYWALHHPPGKPDFHHPDSFSMHLPALG